MVSRNITKINQKPINKLVIWFLLLLTVAVTIGLAVFQFSDKNLHIYFLDVGQGDSIYVRKMNNFDLLIDGGPDNRVISELGAVMPFWDRRIDYVILTHPHADHVTGLIEVMKRYEIGQVLGTDAVHTTNEYLEFLKVIEDKKIPYRLVRSGDKFELTEDIKLDILWPEYSFSEREVNNLNNTSVVAKLSYNNFSVLFTGDIEEEVQKNLVTNIRSDQFSNPFKSAVLKVPHHGSKDGSYEPFIKLVNPELAVIQSGKGNQFGHPSQSTLEKYQQLGSQIFRTDQNGRVEIISDGTTFWTKSTK